jgi:o-succinylbenzoate synthase
VVGVVEAFRPRDGWLAVPRTPPVPDPELLDRYAADPDRDAWWRDRLSRVQKSAM